MTLPDLARRAAADALVLAGPLDGATFPMRTAEPAQHLQGQRRFLALEALAMVRSRPSMPRDEATIAAAFVPRLVELVAGGDVAP